MTAFEVLADPVRRRVLELLPGRERAAGDLTCVVQAEFGLTQPAVSRHLKVLRDSGFMVVRVDGARRMYTLTADPLLQVDAWLDQFRAFWPARLDALATEVARGQKRRRR